MSIYFFRTQWTRVHFTIRPPLQKEYRKCKETAFERFQNFQTLIYYIHLICRQVQVSDRKTKAAFKLDRMSKASLKCFKYFAIGEFYYIPTQPPYLQTLLSQ